MSGKTIMTALATGGQPVMQVSHDTKLRTAGLRRFGLGRKAKDCALVALGEAGLITVQRLNGRNPLISLVITPQE
jgi:hypothetical protein